MELGEPHVSCSACHQVSNQPSKTRPIGLALSVLFGWDHNEHELLNFQPLLFGAWRSFGSFWQWLPSCTLLFCWLSSLAELLPGPLSTLLQALAAVPQPLLGTLGVFSFDLPVVHGNQTHPPGCHGWPSPPNARSLDEWALWSQRMAVESPTSRETPELSLVFAHSFCQCKTRQMHNDDLRSPSWHVFVAVEALETVNV